MSNESVQKTIYSLRKRFEKFDAKRGADGDEE